MFRSVYLKSLWERRISTIWWVLALVLLTAWIVAFYPAIRDSSELQEFITDFPPEMLAMFGIDPLLFTTGFGYLQGQLYSLIGPIILIGMCIGIGAAATAGEEERGTMDLLLAHPVSRTSVVVQKFLAMVTLGLIAVAAMVVVLVIANPLVDLKLSTIGIIGINLGLLALGLTFGTMAMAMGAWRGNKAIAAGVATAAAVVAWFVNAFAPLVDWLQTPQKIQPFSWYLKDDPLLDGPTAWHPLLIGSILLLLAGAVALFRLRDVSSQQPLLSLGRAEEEEGEEAVVVKPGRLDWMLRSVFGKTVWERRTSIWWWLIGLVALAAGTIAFWPTVETGGDAMQGMMDAIPSELLAMFGITDPSSLLTPEGFLSARLYSSIGTLVMLVFAIGAGSGALAGEEQKGTMDLLLGTPTPRRRVANDKALAIIALVAFLAVGLYAVVLVGGFAVDMGLNPANIAAANVGLALLALFFGSLAMAVGAGTGRTGVATGAAAGLAVVAYFLNGFGAALEWMEPARVLSPFYWYLQDSPPLARGFSASYLLLIAGVIVFELATAPLFRRRDIGV
jgi:ABC-2 type transport system permease protein